MGVSRRSGDSSCMRVCEDGDGGVGRAGGAVGLWCVMGVCMSRPRECPAPPMSAVVCVSAWQQCPSYTGRPALVGCLGLAEGRV